MDEAHNEEQRVANEKVDMALEMFEPLLRLCHAVGLEVVVVVAARYEQGERVVIDAIDQTVDPETSVEMLETAIDMIEAEAEAEAEACGCEATALVPPPVNKLDIN